MRRLITVFVVIVMSCNIHGQAQDGIRFDNNLTWEQIVQKANEQNKYIFVDCYATWCKPCKEMDREVYINKKVGLNVNEEFVSVKIQMDSTSKDNSEVRKLFPAARMFEKKYNLNALPSYLFFSPQGKILHRGQGKMSVDEFLVLVSDALNPDKQVYGLVHKWEKGMLQPNQLLDLVQMLAAQNEKVLASQVAKDYMKRYLELLPEDKFLVKGNLIFFHTHRSMLRSTDKIFNLYFKENRRIDSIVEYPGHSRQMILGVIYQEDIAPFLNESTSLASPDFKQLENIISKKYDKSLAIEAIRNFRIKWYRSKNDLINYTKYLVERMKSERNQSFSINSSNMIYINGMADEIFKYSNNTKELVEALAWSNKAVDLNRSAATLDTKANILYKLGKRKEALNIYKEVIELYPGYTVFYKCIEAGLPTWLEAVWPQKMELRKDDAKKLQVATNMQRAKPLSDSSELSGYQTSPNFSGEWKINYFKSEFYANEGFTAAKRFIISQLGDSIQIERFNTGSNREHTYSKESFSLDGTNNILVTDTSQKSIVAFWSTNKKMLKTEWKMKNIKEEDGESVVFRKQSWALSKDENTLTVEQNTQIGKDSRPYTIIAVYDRVFK